MDAALTPYAGERDTAIGLIARFWQEHNREQPDYEAAADDLTRWTAEGQRLYFIRYCGSVAGFVHLGSRGAETDWLEHIFVLPEARNRGIGSRAVALAEGIVREYSESMYIEAAARNMAAIRLYRKLGYNCLNTVSVRKDFRPEDYETIGTERLLDMDFTVKRYKEDTE